jgi:hypothetical protein
MNNSTIVKWWSIWKEAVITISLYYLGEYLEKLSKITENIIQDSQWRPRFETWISWVYISSVTAALNSSMKKFYSLDSRQSKLLGWTDFFLRALNTRIGTLLYLTIRSKGRKWRLCRYVHLEICRLKCQVEHYLQTYVHQSSWFKRHSY